MTHDAANKQDTGRGAGGWEVEIEGWNGAGWFRSMTTHYC